MKVANADMDVLVSSRDTSGQYTICRLDIQGSGGPPLHAHLYEDGFFYVLDGNFEFQVGDQTMAVGAGASMFIPRGRAYAFQHQGTGVGRLLVMANPGGLDLLLQDLGVLASRGGLFDRANLEPLLEKHGITVP